MASVIPAHQAHAYHHATHIPEKVINALLENEAAANVILPFVSEARSFDGENADEQLWIALFDGNENVEFVLSCTKGPLGNYPIFIVACKPSRLAVQEEESGENLDASLLPLVRCLLEQVPYERIFSVFATAKLKETLSKILEERTPLKALENTYYDATLTFCTKETLVNYLDLDCTFKPKGSEDIAIALRPANMSHLNGVKALCKAFSETSPPYILDDARAELEARTMITNHQAWIHIVQNGNQTEEVACLIAATRESENVITITKVFTAEHLRGQHCASLLLHRLCQDFLLEKERVVLYVGNGAEEKPARNMYRSVGFQGLEGDPKVQGVEKWVEIGFENTTLGHW